MTQTLSEQTVVAPERLRHRVDQAQLPLTTAEVLPLEVESAPSQRLHPSHVTWCINPHRSDWTTSKAKGLTCDSIYEA